MVRKAEVSEVEVTNKVTEAVAERIHTAIEKIETIQNRDYAEEALSFLNDQQSLHEFGFVKMAPNKGATSFDCGPVGTIESPVEAIIIDMNPQRTLWPFGIESAVKEVREWSKRPICSSRNEYDERGSLLKVGCVRGKVAELDGNEPTQVKYLIEPPLACGCTCAKCQWAEYGTAFSGAGQACKEGRYLLLWLVEEKSFVTLQITPASLKNWNQFDIGLLGKHFHSVVASFSSVPSSMKSDESIKYSAIKIDIARSGKERIYTKKDDFIMMSAPMMYHNKSIPMVRAYVSEFRQLEPEFEYDAETGDVEF